MKKTMTGLVTMALLTAACQSNSYKINGVAESLQDGDTLYITSGLDDDKVDTLIVRDGKFQLEGVADSATFCLVRAADGSVGAPFFREPGTINITLGADGTATVAGTKANDAWQELNDRQMALNQKMEQLVAPLYAEDVDSAQQEAIFSQYKALQEEQENMLVEAVEKNIDNEMGFFLFTQMVPSGIMPTEKVQQLLDRMPQAYRQRETVKAIEKMLEAAHATEIGQTIEDFTFPTPDGGELSVMSEVAKNRVTILDFWASWCGPCREETPFMVSLYERYHDKGLGIVGISLDQDHDAWVKGIEDLGMQWPQISDLRYWQSAAAEQFQIRSIPYMVVVDQQGVIINRGIRGEELEAFISEKLQ